jgi:hypothetical protein
MKRLLESKASVALMAITGLIAMLLLSAALRDLTFRLPEPFSFNLGGLLSLSSAGPAVNIPVWRYVVFGGLLFLILAAILFFLDPELRKRILLRLLRFGLEMLALWILLNYAYQRGSLKLLLNLSPAAGASDSAATAQAGAPVYIPPQISPWLVLAVSFVIGLALVLLGWFIYTRRPKLRAGQALDEVAGIAREALNELQPGHNWDDAIVRAYIRMNEVVTSERGLTRQPGSTPSEFAERMERIGLPGEAVRTLTRLFEAVRYGGKISSRAERDLAAAALGAILSNSGRRV